jgi:hypothetical protein
LAAQAGNGLLDPRPFDCEQLAGAISVHDESVSLGGFAPLTIAVVS